VPDLRSASLVLAAALAAQAQAPAIKAPSPDAATGATHTDDPRALMLKARAKQLREGGDDPKGAAALYRQVIAMVPGSAEAHLRLSEALEESKDLEGAIAEAKKAVALNPASGEALGQEGSLLFHKARTDKAAIPDAKRALLAATDRLPSDPQMWAFLAEAAEADSDDRAAMDAWIHLGRLRPDFTPAWERAAIHAWVLKDYDGRRESIMALCGRDGARPEDLKLLQDLAQEQVKNGFLGHAEESYALLAERMPEEPAVWERLALVELRVPEYPKALAHLQKAEALRPDPGVSFNLALCLMNMGRFQEALVRTGDQLKTLPGSDLPRKDKLLDLCQVLHGQSLLLLGDPKALLAWLKAVPARPGAAGDLAVLRAQALIETGAFGAAKDAVAEGRKAYGDRPFFKNAPDLSGPRKAAETRLRQMDLQTLAELWAGFGQWQTCLGTLEKAKALDLPPNADLLLLEANAYDQLGRPADNLQALRAAQRIAPANATLQNNLGYLLLDSGGDLKEAASLIEAAVKQEPGNGSFIDSLGWLRFKQGDFKEAEAQLRRAAELRPYSADVRQHLGEVLLKAGKVKEALAQWERALAFAFPGRDELEKRVDEVRAEQAKRKFQAPEAGDGGDEDSE
jgi:tetratricopeptide (TPR) repeat protein